MNDKIGLCDVRQASNLNISMKFRLSPCKDQYIAHCKIGYETPQTSLWYGCSKFNVIHCGREVGDVSRININWVWCGLYLKLLHKVVKIMERRIRKWETTT